MSDLEAKLLPDLDTVKRCVEELRQLQRRIRERTQGSAALSSAEVRIAIEHGRK